MAAMIEANVISRVRAEAAWDSRATSPVVHIIDDNSAIRDGASSLFESKGWTVREHFSAEKFLAGKPPTGDYCPPTGDYVRLNFFRDMVSGMVGLSFFQLCYNITYWARLALLCRNRKWSRLLFSGRMILALGRSFFTLGPGQRHRQKQRHNLDVLMSLMRSQSDFV